VSAPPNGNFFPGEPRHNTSPDGTSSVPLRSVSDDRPPANVDRLEGLNQPRAPSPPPPIPPLNPSAATVTPPRSSSQPAPAPKNVAFDLGSEASQISSPDLRRHKRRGEMNRGYEAEDDSESPLDGRDKRYPTHHPVSETESDPEQSSRRRRHRRNRPHDEDRHHDDSRRTRSSRSSRSGRDRDGRTFSPYDSDATVELPERFDKDGRKKPEKGEDPIADALDDLFSGKGAGGKYLKKIFGGGASDEESDGGRRRRR
jgi:hypothetical protein